MSQTIPYEEGYGVQESLPSPTQGKPIKFTKKYFIDLNQVTVASADNLDDAREFKAFYPGSEIRIYNPTQAELRVEQKDRRDLMMNNWGVMAPG